MSKIFRPPICTVLGHVDVGKTSFLDMLRSSNVLDNEPGAITQKIGITQINEQRLAEMVSCFDKKLTFPGIMFVDTPGHECFTKERLDGLEICDFCIVLVDIFKGVEKGTIDIINLLKKYKIPFLVGVNKLDRIDGWENGDNIRLKNAISGQKQHVKNTINELTNNIVVQLATHGLNGSLFYKNPDMDEYINLCPFSAKTGIGVPDILMLTDILLSKFMQKRLQVKPDITTGFFLEKINDKKLGQLVIGVLTDGEVKQGGKIVTLDKYGDILEVDVMGMYVVHNNAEIKDSSKYQKDSHIYAPTTVAFKIDKLDAVVSGTRFFVRGNLDIDFITTRLKTKRGNIDELSNREYDDDGVYINAQTDGMVDALYTICKENNIKVKGCFLGRLSKADIIKITNINCGTFDPIYYKQYQVLLVFGLDYNKSDKMNTVKLLEQSGILIVSNNIVYRIVDQYLQFRETIFDKMREKYPTVVKDIHMDILKEYVFRKKEPIIIGVKIKKGGPLKPGSLVSTNGLNGSQLFLGCVKSIQSDKKSLDEAKVGQEVCLRIDPVKKSYEYGKDFEDGEISLYYTDHDLELFNKYPNVF